MVNCYFTIIMVSICWTLCIDLGLTLIENILHVVLLMETSFETRTFRTHTNIHAVISFMIRRSTCLLTCSRIVILSLLRCFYLLVCTEYFNNPISLLLFSTFPFCSSLIIVNELLSILLHHYLFQSERFFKVTRFPSICLLFYSIILPHCVCLCSVFKFLFWFLCIRIFLFMIFIHFPRLQSLWWLLILPRKTLQRIEIYFPISYFTTRTKAK